MIDFCWKKDALGLSACQVGVFENFFVMKRRAIKPRPFKAFIYKDYMLVINPIFKPIGSGKSKAYKEGCLSYPNELFVIKRFDQIFINFWSIVVTEKLSYFFLTGGGVLKSTESCIFQHEADHCKGITIKMKGIKIIL